MFSAKLLQRLKHFDEWYQEKINEQEKKLSTLKLQYQKKREAIIRKAHQQDHR